ncbi:serine/threonine-protein kinase [Actinomadura namibiensis]|uniref:Protein kinase domain-containing protein n=1 Tax=Actinomadura namibiensis TaxID=182080 RepID=A0A7W3LJ56_ACTNM|nr:serine/threonine-protein kinase [Actinomadura namibiensis]MBA8949156.1 hypothetical protein [Actinomadura namibiensis]
MVAVSPLGPDDPHEVGRWRLTGRLGEGGQGVVYLAEDPAGRRVAVKTLKTADPEARARFAREMEAARRVAPFCTAAVLDCSADAARPYVVSEFVDGPSLQRRVAERGPLRDGDLERLAVNTASALAAIHGAGIVHRDLKPANVLLGPDGPRVVDFGIAREVDAGTRTRPAGTPSYSAPESLAGRPPTPASDVFAWAGTMVYAATGRPPFGRFDRMSDVMRRIAHEHPDLGGVPPFLHGLLAECLDKDPARRPTARDLMVRLVDPSAVPSIGGEPTVPSRRRAGRGALIAAGAGLAVVAATAGIWFAVNDQRDRPGENVTTTRTASPDPTPGAGGGTKVPAAFAGTWTGTIAQPPGLGAPNGTSTDATVVLRAGESRGESVYRAWGCTDTLQVTAVDGDTLRIQETPNNTHGTTGFCLGGSLTLRLVDGRLRYESEGLGGTTSGTLGRSG